MKKFMMFLAVLGLLMFAGSAFAQEQGQGGGDHPRGEGHGGQHGGMMNSEAMLDHMSKELNLTDDQKAKVKTILEDQRKQMEELRNDQNSSQEDRRSKMQEIRKSTEEKINGVLNDEQKKKFEEMRKRGPGQGHGEHHGEGDHPQQ